MCHQQSYRHPSSSVSQLPAFAAAASASCASLEYNCAQKASNTGTIYWCIYQREEAPIRSNPFFSQTVQLFQGVAHMYVAIESKDCLFSPSLSQVHRNMTVCSGHLQLGSLHRLVVVRTPMLHSWQMRFWIPCLQTWKGRGSH